MLYGAVYQTNGQTIPTNIPSPSLVCLVDISLVTTTHLQDVSGNLLSVTLKEN
jgi:flagellar biosynthesis GTPase FlhF